MKSKEKSGVVVGVVWNCPEMKFLLITLLILGSSLTALQFFPPRTPFSTVDFRSCISKIFTDLPPETLNLTSPDLPPENLNLTSPENPGPRQEYQNGTILHRVFNSYGAAAYTFIQMGAYRGGLDTFAVIGLASKPLHVYGKPRFDCEWIPANSSNSSALNLTVKGVKMLPDWGYGRVYTVVVINCTFPVNVGEDRSGGKLVIHAYHGNGDGGLENRPPEKIIALTEPGGALNVRLYTSPPQYDFVYCGSSLYGNLSPQRVREWIAYHVRLFGKKSLIVIHDAGGVHPGVMEVLKPWIESGFVVLQDIKEQEVFDGYYHNQFLVVNDCLHRYRFMAKWIFFFDVDEFIYLPAKSNLHSVVKSLSNYTQFTIEQMPMSSKLCRADDAGKTARMWGFEKLVFKNVKRGVRRDRKYAIQPRNAFATGVHMSENVVGKAQHKTEGKIKYFHYHGTISNRREPCRNFVNTSELAFEGNPYVLDETLRSIAPSVKRFEFKNIGSRLRFTRQ